MLKRLPLLKLLAIAQIVLLARRHAVRLDRGERRRLRELLAHGARDRHLTADERRELADLIRKAEPRAFFGGAVDRLSPVPLPKRVTHGSRKERRRAEEALS
ncbi:MAG TPA: hypothetical protein VN751_09550 [Solirubrobacteraceae bacterium]|jgi:hypothetical protein|nr:hypothetical protein [Solirubrobacteraceae bacterium]